jgi:hypothetical protein
MPTSKSSYDGGRGSRGLFGLCVQTLLILIAVLAGLAYYLGAFTTVEWREVTSEGACAGGCAPMCGRCVCVVRRADVRAVLDVDLPSLMW